MFEKLGSEFIYKSLPKYEGLKGKLPIYHPNIYVGVEIELEKVTAVSIPSTFINDEDHSLKVNGREFISIPIRAKYLEVELTRLFEGLSQYETSVRCSTHVHVNVRDLTLEEVNKLLILYMIFEKCLFNFAGRNRWANNFCTPLYLCPKSIPKWFTHPFTTWYKYFALNLSPIFGGQSKKVGTIEFRHLGGCSDIPKIIQWVNLITSLKMASKKFTMEDLINHLETMNTTSAYWWLAKEVFGKSSKIITDSPTFKEDVESCITQTKYIVLEPNIKKKILAKPKEEKKTEETGQTQAKQTEDEIKKALFDEYNYYMEKINNTKPFIVKKSVWATNMNGISALDIEDDEFKAPTF